MSHKKNVPIKTELEQFYNQVKSISKTSKHYHTSNPTVRKWLKHYDIPLYTHKEAVEHDFLIKTVEMPTREDLLFLYTNMSISDIRKIYGIGQETFYSWLDQLNIDVIDHSVKVSTVKGNRFSERFSLSKDQIEDDYKSCGSIGALALHYNCSYSTIRKLFRMYDVAATFAKTSTGQAEVSSYINSLGLSTTINDRKTIAPLELDIVVDGKNVAIEYCGNYYHSETWGNKPRGYHLNKYNLCKEKGINLITLFDSEWKTKPNVIKSVLSHKLGTTEKRVYGRHTVCQEINEYSTIRNFEMENHIQGSRPAERYYGLFYQGDLIMSMSFGKSRFNKNFDYEMVRMTTKIGYSVVGGASKLFKFSKINNCITYADNRFGEGKVYETLGFTKLHQSAPNYFYFHKSDHNKMYSRNKFQKHKIEGADLSKSEYENMLDRGYDRIWDCGNSVYGFIR